MKNTLEKILTFDKRDREESSLYTSLLSVFSNIDPITDDNDNSEEFARFDEFLNKISSGILDGKITLAGFNKIINANSLNEYNTDVFFDLMEDNVYSDSYDRTFASITSRRIADKKVDFLSLILFNTMKEVAIPSKALLSNDVESTISILNKFYLMLIFKKWKELGYIHSTNIDGMNSRNTFSRYCSTCKNAVFNIYNKFTEDGKDPYVISDKLDEKYKRKLLLLNDSKSSTIMYSLKFLFTFNSFYDKYKESYANLAKDNFEYGRHLKLQNNINTDTNFIETSLILSAYNIYFNKSSHSYGYGTNLDGTWKIVVNFSNALSGNDCVHFNTKRGLIGLNSTEMGRVTGLPTSNLKDIVSLYNKFGFSVEGSGVQDDAISSIVALAYECRNNLEYDLTLNNLVVFFSSNNLTGSGTNYSCINKMLTSFFNTIKLIKSEVDFDSYYVNKIKIFMPFLYFILDINHILSHGISSGYGALGSKLFQLTDTDLNSENIDEFIIDIYCNIFNGIKDIKTVFLKPYDNFPVNTLCKLYRLYLEKLGFDIDKSVIDNKYIFFIHLNDFIISIVNYINSEYEKSGEENIYSFKDVLYINEALKKSKIIEEVNV